jgi:hypothetical protein
LPNNLLQLPSRRKARDGLCQTDSGEEIAAREFRNVWIWPLTLARQSERRICRPGPFLCQAAPPGITHAIGTVSVKTIPYEINIGMIFICRPVTLEIVEKRWPVRQQMVNLKVT